MAHDTDVPVEADGISISGHDLRQSRKRAAGVGSGDSHETQGVNTDSLPLKDGVPVFPGDEDEAEREA